jgi:modulator of FtsH protease HflK
MAWNEPGGGNKRRDPWQGGGGGNEPDIDAMLKRARDRFGRVVGKGPGGGGVWLIVAGVLALWIGFTSWKTIDETQRGVVLRFGKFDRVMGAGLNFKWPAPIEQVYVVDATRVRSESDEVPMLTKDENIAIIEFNVQYSVGDPYKFEFAVREPDTTLKKAAESAVRQVIGAHTMDEVLLGERTALANSAKEILQATLDRYGAGIAVTGFNFQRARPPQELKDAFDDATNALQDRQRLESEAQAYLSKVVPEARGEAARVLAEAEGDKTEAVARATGAADRFSLLATQYRAAPEVTRKRLYLETMQEVLSRNAKVVADPDSNNVLYLPINQPASAAAPAAATQPLMPDRAAVGAIQTVEPVRERSRSGRSGREGRD